MQYYSTSDRAIKADFKEASIKGQAPDKGLYFPEIIPHLPKEFIENITSYSKEEIAYAVIKPYTGNTIPEKELQRIVRETIPFDFPLVQLDENIFSLELYHGPTLAFKDVGARFMSRCLGYFVAGLDRKITVLVATSGDTGGAVANGFYGVEGVDVVILYPSGKVSSVQELQLTTMGKNISAVEIKGSFDDCQLLVKQAFADERLNREIFLTSANSINIARWLPQQFYYFFAWQQWKDKGRPPVISVPSGNFGNICAGLIANQSGLPTTHFIAACNSNDVITEYLLTGKFRPRPAQATLSNAMDVGNPSNFVRLLALFDKEIKSFRNLLSACTVSDEETKKMIRETWSKFHYLTDPHGAVGYFALKKYLEKNQGQKGIFLETAHPVKFYDVVEPITGEKISLPQAIQSILKKQKQTTRLEVDYKSFKQYLLSGK